MDNLDDTNLLHVERTSRSNSIDESWTGNGSSGTTKKSSAKHLYSVKEKEKDVQKDHNELQTNLKNLQQQVQGGNIDQDIVNQITALQQAFDSNMTKWQATESLVTVLRNQKGDLEIQVQNLTSSLLEAQHEVKASHQRIVELERELQSREHTPVLSQAPLLTSPSVVPVVPAQDYTKNFHDISNALGSLSSQLESHFASIRQLVEDNTGSVTKLHSFQNETQNALSQIQQAQLDLQTAIANIQIPVQTSFQSASLKSSTENLCTETLPTSDSQTQTEEATSLAVPSPVPSQPTVDSTLLLTSMKSELEAFKNEILAAFQVAQHPVLQVPTETKEPEQPLQVKEPVKEPAKETAKESSKPTSKAAPATKSAKSAAPAAKTTSTASRTATKATTVASKATTTATKKA
mmetsp:Transcript_10123/g.13904  ORF Transcript_10123/g.13904 Transcript_10123/m.13904 type:complete len:406 (-) Transcript_10123:161-1378(-)